MNYGRVFLWLVVLIILAQFGIRTVEPGAANLPSGILAMVSGVVVLVVIFMLWKEYRQL
jgi:hypothetical protein